MTKFDVILLTEPRYENPVDPTPYQQQILTEDGIVRSALEAQGLRVARVDWSCPNFDWGSTQLAVFRTTWDYFYRIDEFLPWLEQTTTKTQLMNPYSLIRWNLNKRYLLDLEDRGIRIPPTRLVPRGGIWNLMDSFREWDCAELIIKPCVGDTARHTYRIAPADCAAQQVIFNTLCAVEDMLVQPFLTSITVTGEVSLLLFGGKYSHAVLKRAKAGDFRVQDDFGGTAQPYTPTQAELQLAHQCVQACTLQPAYARVDIVYDQEGTPCVSELEIIEPELFFRFQPAAATLLVKEIIQCLELR